MYCFSFSGTRSIIFGTLKIGQNDPAIPNLEFENHGFLENQVFLPTEQVGTNICWMIYQDINFQICLNLFGWKENILHKQHIVQCTNLEDTFGTQRYCARLNLQQHAHSHAWYKIKSTPNELKNFHQSRFSIQSNAQKTYSPILFQLAIRG